MDRRREPIFNVPTAVAAVVAVLALIHGGRSFLSEEADTQLVLLLAFIPARYGALGADLPGGEIAGVTSFVTHMLLHGDITHLLINCAWLLAFGSAIAKRAGGKRFLALSIASGIAGAMMFLVLSNDPMATMIGASGAVSGLMGGLMRFFFKAIDTGGLWQLREAPWLVPRQSLSEALTDRRIIATTAVWILINLFMASGAGDFTDLGGIAWQAHLGGFFLGLFAFGWFDRQLPPGREVLT